MEKRFEGRFAVVTGAASGIGRAVAVRLAAEGATVLVNHLATPEEATTTLGLLQPGNHFAHEADVADEAAVTAMFAVAIARWGRVDVLVNNAGICVGVPTEAMLAAQWRQVMDVNLTGAVFCAQAAIRHFLSRPGGGAIVNCSSVHQVVPKPGFLAYAASKGAMDNVTRTLALEYADRGIRVNAVGPGATETPMNAAWTGDPARRKVVEAHIPMGRPGTPDEMAAAFAFLASDEAGYVTGQTLLVCGGLSLFAEFRINWAT